MITLAQNQPQGDFTIPAPAPAAPGQPAPPRAGTQTDPTPFSGLDRSPSTTDTVLGAGLLVVLAVVFLFVRQGVRTHLVGRRAALDAANGASWMLFSALMLTAGVLTAATLGGLWRYWLGVGAALALCAVLFIVFAILFVRAPGRRR
ncbi:hypothetical protein [Methylobacterium trifolii]|uniref:DUF3325 domain-containing protein n=1 Tax=Methylobacterium trifolii TaxID=1003092 RepID=A0ABQ4U3J8_9HYPH|nr:hypothetical protein [Methylobacterium trifolii]GJE61578.1 hypothetical protein MPOCJGCO_3700 [Methylobacterium trifolii]